MTDNFGKDIAAKLKQAEKDLQNNVDLVGAATGPLEFIDTKVDNVSTCPDALISHSIQYLGTHAKLIYHIKGVSHSVMEKLADEGRRICIEVLNKIPKERITADVGKSPIFRSQWDFIVWGIPILRSSELRKHILGCFVTKLREIE